MKVFEKIDMTLNQRLLITFLPLSLLFLAIASLRGYMASRDLLIEEVLNHLASVAAIQEQRMEGLLEQNLERLALVASRTQMRIVLDRYNESRNPTDYQQMITILQDARSSIASFTDMFLLNTQGEIVASTDEKRVGENWSGRAFLKQGQHDNQVDHLILDENRQVKFVLSGRLHLEEKWIGGIVIHSNTDALVEAVQDYSGLGETGESYLAQWNTEGDALFIVPLRFDAQAALQKTVSKENQKAPIIQALSKQEQLMQEAMDYRNESVLAVTHYIELADWGLVVKMDRQEAFARLDELRVTLVLIFILAAGLLGIVIFVIARSLARPLVGLAETATQISEGALDRRLAPSLSVTEIERLSASFNQMTDALVEANQREKEQAEVQLKASEAKYRLLFEKMLNGFIHCELIYDAEGHPCDAQILDVNPAWEKIMGMRKNEVEGKRLTAVFPQAETFWIKVMGEVVQTRMSRYLEQYTEATQRYYEMFFFPSENQRCDVIFNDVTQRKSLETQLRHAQKMESLGIMAGGIAHEFNNILAGTQGMLELLLLDLEANHPLRQSLIQVDETEKRALDLVQQILTFARKETVKFEELNPAPIVQQAISIVRATFPSSIDLHLDIPHEVGPILGNSTQLHQVVVNLLNNARQAIGDQTGRIFVELSNIRCQECPELRDDGLEADGLEADGLEADEIAECVRLTVQDTGVGIPAENLNKIFDPFFTTKEVGQGTGLGLSVIHGIVEGHRGKIRVDSQVGKGATFVLCLPI